MRGTGQGQGESQQLVLSKAVSHFYLIATTSECICQKYARFCLSVYVRVCVSELCVCSTVPLPEANGKQGLRGRCLCSRRSSVFLPRQSLSSCCGGPALLIKARWWHSQSGGLLRCRSRFLKICFLYIYLLMDCRIPQIKTQAVTPSCISVVHGTPQEDV